MPQSGSGRVGRPKRGRKVNQKRTSRWHGAESDDAGSPTVRGDCGTRSRGRCMVAALVGVVVVAVLVTAVASTSVDAAATSTWKPGETRGGAPVVGTPGLRSGGSAAASAAAPTPEELAAVDEASQQLPTPPAAQAVQQEAHTAAAGRTGCTLEFKAYVPAAWEAQWRDRVGEWQPHMCPIMVAQKPRAKQMLELVAVDMRRVPERATVHTTAAREELLSQMHYYLKCSDTSATGRVTSTTTVVREWIEPLTGFLRDPLTKICKQFGKAGVPLQSKDFLLVRSAGVVKPVLPPRGRTILVDAGCGMFSGPKDFDHGWISLEWLVRRYGALGVEFTDIIGFESHPITPRQFFSEMPPELVPRFRLYNTGNDAKVGSVFNPWTHVRALAEPGDFVVVKLDIDSPGIENELMAQLLADEQLLGLVDEMFYEHHVSLDGPDRAWNTRRGRPNVVDSYKMFTELRQRGVRMHSWP